VPALGKYVAIVIAGFKQELVYKMDYFISLIFRILASLISIFVWTAVFTSSGVSSIGGLTLSEMYIYFFIVNAIGIITFNDSMAGRLQDDIQSGNITTALTKPVRYPTQLFYNAIAVNLVALLSVSLPFLVIITFLAHLTITLTTLLLFITEIVVAYLITTLVCFMVGTTAVYLVNIWGILSVTDGLYFLLGGGIVPLSLFPSWASQILLLLPTQLSAYTPTATLLGIISTQQAINEIIIGLVWIVVFFAAAALFWRKVNMNITSAGG
jgi:ABC-2 type transport system permease protein